MNTCALCNNNQFKIVAKTFWTYQKCLYCSLVQVNPIPAQKRINMLYKGSYSKNYQPYQSQLHAHENYFKLKIKQLKKHKQKGTLLEIGCALGTFMNIAKNAGYHVSGIDISPYSALYCRKNNLRAKTGNIQTISKDKKYDIITAFDVLEHEINPIKTTLTIHQLLKIQGLFICSVPNYDSLTRYILRNKWFGFYDKEHLFYFNKNTLHTLLKKFGFSKITILKDDSRSYKLTYYLQRLNHYFFHSKLLNVCINILTRIPLINNIKIHFNAWGNIIAFAYK
ncbi:MAG: class I SAM-dependent methyltransferase [bacterium]|nr:class I SAM-dependent methyltransferase [bacterium]